MVTFSGLGEGLDRLGTRFVHEHELLLRIVDGHAELGAHVGLKEHHGAADKPKYIICDSLDNLQPAGCHVVFIRVLYLAKKLSSGGDKVADDVSEVDHCVNGHQPFLHDELGRVKLFYCLAKTAYRIDQNERRHHLHDQ